MAGEETEDEKGQGFASATIVKRFFERSVLTGDHIEAVEREGKAKDEDEEGEG